MCYVLLTAATNNHVVSKDQTCWNHHTSYLSLPILHLAYILDRSSRNSECWNSECMFLMNDRHSPHNIQPDIDCFLNNGKINNYATVWYQTSTIYYIIYFPLFVILLQLSLCYIIYSTTTVMTSNSFYMSLLTLYNFI